MVVMNKIKQALGAADETVVILWDNLFEAVGDDAPLDKIGPRGRRTFPCELRVHACQRDGSVRRLEWLQFLSAG